MSEGLDDLTDKEKEALRLLLAGHDAKSSANELDISVHTVNDRLRNARRKLNVSSSREAARILGEAEGTAPQNPAHASFGITHGGDAEDNAILTNTKRAGPFGLTWLAGGMLIMSILIAAAVLGLMYTSGDQAPAAAKTEIAAEKPAAEAPASLSRAQYFLAAVDQGNWQESWDRAGAYFQSQVSADQWAAQGRPVRQPLGAVTSRELSNVNRAATLPGAPEGEYEVLQFTTKFAAVEKPAIETVVMLMGDDGWEVVGYFVRPGA